MNLVGRKGGVTGVKPCVRRTGTEILMMAQWEGWCGSGVKSDVNRWVESEEKGEVGRVRQVWKVGVEGGGGSGGRGVRVGAGLGRSLLKFLANEMCQTVQNGIQCIAYPENSHCLDTDLHSDHTCCNRNM